jgi:nucleotide-binding universal stress UspA family protein
LPLAVHLAERRGIPLTLVHVLDVPPDLASFMRAGSGVDALLEIERGTHRYLEQVAEGIAGVPVETAVLHGQPAAQLVEYLDTLEQPLVVMSSHGRSGFRRMALGSVTAQVVRAAHAPVMLVRVAEDGAGVEVPGRIRRVLVPLDGSDFSEHALRATYELVTSKDVAIHLLRVPEVAAYPATMYGAASYETIETYMDAVQTEAERYLTGIADELKREHEGEVTWEVRQGAPAIAILEAAREFNADLIAMASHGRTGFRRFLMGSVAEEVLRDAHLPVLIVGPHDVDDTAG